MRKQTPASPIAIFMISESAFLEPSEQRIPAYADQSADFGGPVVGGSVNYDRHAESPKLHYPGIPYLISQASLIPC